MQTEFLFRMCELCLAFDVSDRAVARDLGRWTGVAFGKNWWKAGEVCAAQTDYAKLVESRNVLSIVGRAIARAAFPEVWAPALVNVVANPPHVVMGGGRGEDRAAPTVCAAPLFPVQKDAARVDLETGQANLQSGEDEQDGDARRVAFRCKVFGIILLVMLGAAGLLVASIGIVRARENSQKHPTTEPQDAVRPTVVPGTATVDTSFPKQPLGELVPSAKTPPFVVSWEGTMR